MGASGGEQGEERGRRGQGSACGAGHCAGLAARPAQPALGSEPYPRTPARTRGRPWAALGRGAEFAAVACVMEAGKTTLLRKAAEA